MNYKAQVARPGPGKHEWARPWDGWLPGWHTFEQGSLTECRFAMANYLASGGTADTRIVPVAQRDDEDVR